MAEDKKPDPTKDTSKPGREEEVIENNPAEEKGNAVSNATTLPVDDKSGKNETEGERRFKEGMANNNDTES